MAGDLVLNSRELLWRLVLGADEIARAAAITIGRQNEWSDTVQLAFRWKILPELNRKLARLEVLLPLGPAKELRQLTLQSFLRSTRVALRGAEAVASLQREGISAAAFKGLAILTVGSETRSGRTLQDVDVLVTRHDVMRAVRLLEREGYKSGIPGGLDDYFAFVACSPGFSGNEAIALTAPDGAEIDLHWRVGPRDDTRFTAESLLSRAVDGTFKGRALHVLDAVDCVLLTVHHSVRNNFVPDQMVRDLLDAAAWITVLHSRNGLSQLTRAAQTSSLMAPLSAMTNIFLRLQPAQQPSDPLAALAREIAIASDAPEGESVAHSLEELVAHQLRNGPLNSDLLYLMRGDAARLVLGGAVRGWSSYRQQMRLLEIKKRGEPLSFVRRLRDLWKSVRSAERSHWSLLRTLSTIKR